MNIEVLTKCLSVRSIPRLFWSSDKPLTFKPTITSLAFLILGLFLFGLGEALLIAAGTGVSPWTVFAQGISNVTGWTVGFSTFVTSVTVLVLWIPLKQTPGIGTILNAVIIALVLDFGLPYLPKAHDLGYQILEAIAGVLITCLGGAIYLISNLGPGPRDGLMTGLQKLTNLPIAWVRSGIECTVVLIGWLLGGTVGFGTILFALGIGPAVSTSIFFLNSFFGDTIKKKKL